MRTHSITQHESPERMNSAVFEDALQDAQNLTAFLQNVADLGSKAGDENHDTSVSGAAWAGLYLVHEMIAEKLAVISACYYGPDDLK